MGDEQGVIPLRWDAEGSQSLCRADNTLGITGASRQTAIKLITEAAEVASRQLWRRVSDG